MKRIVLTTLFVLMALSGLMKAAVGQGESFDANKSRWEAMSKEERAEIVSAYRHWKGLDEGTRDRILNRYKQFRGLSEEEKVNVVINVERFRQLPPEKRAMLRRHLHAGPEKRYTQVCFMRILSDMQQANPGQRIDPRAVYAKLMEWHGRYLDEVVYQSLTDEEKAKVDSATGQERYGLLVEAMRQDVLADPPAGLGEPGSLGYEMRLWDAMTRKSSQWIAGQLPPGIFEIAFAIRSKAVVTFPREKLAEIVKAPEGEVRAKVEALAQTDEMKSIIAEMPAELKARYDSFDDAKKLDVLVAAFKPMRDIGPRIGRRHFGLRPGQRHVGPALEPAGDAQAAPGDPKEHSH